MKHIFFYDQGTDIPYFSFLQAEQITLHRKQIVGTWQKTHPIQKQFWLLEPNILTTGLMTPAMLEQGFCLGLVFFIFKMLYSGQADGGLGWSDRFVSGLNSPMWQRNEVEKIGYVFELNHIVDDFLALCLRNSQSNFSDSELKHISTKIYRVISTDYGSDRRQPGFRFEDADNLLSDVRMILDRKIEILQTMHTRSKDQIMRSSADRNMILPMSAEPDLQQLLNFLKPENINKSNPNLFPTLCNTIRSIPSSFCFFIHHFSHLHDGRSVCFPFINAVMDVQGLEKDRIIKGLPLKSFAALSPTASSDFSDYISKYALLYEKFVRQSSVVPQITLQDAWIFHRENIRIVHPRVGHNNDHIARTIDIDLAATMLAYPTTLGAHYGQYTVNYFILLRTQFIRQHVASAHIICAWSQNNRHTPSAQPEFFIFDPNHGLWQLEDTETPGFGIISAVCKQFSLTEGDIDLKIIVFRGFC